MVAAAVVDKEHLPGVHRLCVHQVGQATVEQGQGFLFVISRDKDRYTFHVCGWVGVHSLGDLRAVRTRMKLMGTVMA